MNIRVSYEKLHFIVILKQVPNPLQTVSIFSKGFPNKFDVSNERIIYAFASFSIGLNVPFVSLEWLPKQKVSQVPNESKGYQQDCHSNHGNKDYLFCF